MTDHNRNKFLQIVNDLNALCERLTEGLPSHDDPELQSLSRRGLQRLMNATSKARPQLANICNADVVGWMQDLEKTAGDLISDMDKKDQYQTAVDVSTKFPAFVDDAKKTIYFAAMQNTITEMQTAIDAWKTLVASEDARPYNDPSVQAQAKVVIDLWNKYVPEPSPANAASSSSSSDSASGAKRKASVMVEITDDEVRIVSVKKETVKNTDDGDLTEDDDPVASDASNAGSSEPKQPKPVSSSEAGPAKPRTKKSSYANSIWVEAWETYKISIDKGHEHWQVVKAIIPYLKERKNHSRSVKTERSSVLEICEIHRIDKVTAMAILKEIIEPGVVNTYDTTGSE
jgi:hypothetical protein